MKLYIHTVDGQPGYFDGEQIVFAERRDHWKDDYPLCVAVKSEAQIRSERERSIAFRRKHKFDVPAYDFVIISTVPGVIKWENGEANA